jgi:GGDEF domain-containing protein
MNTLNSHEIIGPNEIKDLSSLINLSNFWGRSWRLGFQGRKRLSSPPAVSTTTDDLLRSSEILHSKTHLPNAKFLSLLLDFIHSSASTVRFPMGIVKLAIDHFDLFQKLYPQLVLDQNTDLLIGSIMRSIQDDHDVLVQVSDGSFYVVSFEASLSSLTKMVSDLNKTLHGLTIPYPPGQVCSDVNVSAGIALFTQVDGVDSGEDFLLLSAQALEKSLMTGKVEVLIGPRTQQE